MISRLEGGAHLKEYEVPLLFALLQIWNSKDVTNYDDLLKAWMKRLNDLESQIQSQQSLRTMTQPQRRPVGPPNQGLPQAPNPLDNYYGNDGQQRG